MIPQCVAQACRNRELRSGRGRAYSLVIGLIYLRNTAGKSVFGSTVMRCSAAFQEFSGALMYCGVTLRRARRAAPLTLMRRGDGAAFGELEGCILPRALASVVTWYRPQYKRV